LVVKAVRPASKAGVEKATFGSGKRAATAGETGGTETTGGVGGSGGGVTGADGGGATSRGGGGGAAGAGASVAGAGRGGGSWVGAGAGARGIGVEQAPSRTRPATAAAGQRCPKKRRLPSIPAPSRRERPAWPRNIALGLADARRR
jgi:hypothetical protein